MDQGAHYFCSDLQVHTPRDLNWKGAGAKTDAERRQYAQDFVAACRQKGVRAVAITDHNDVAFFKHIRDAAAQESDSLGNSLPPDDQLVVFPGVELTLGVPCQALLILDADFPIDFLPQVLQALSITPSPETDEHHAQIARLEHIKTLEDLYDELNKRDFLKGRFIVFPNVGESGQFSIIRKGFAAQYKKMPCVGGYVDGPAGVGGTGNAAILAGKNKEWGNKAVAVIQTSDNRARDFSSLGIHPTWIKWAGPTAEALRQACLARHSRVSLSQPQLPTARITAVEVTNSKFLGPINLELNPQYNALIGGRGTGKSTILEYLRWALCDQPAGASDSDEPVDYQHRRRSLIENTLIPLNAAVDVSFLLDGVMHVVRRKATGELTLKIGDKPFEPCTEDNVRELLPIRAYSQKQLSAVGARLEELRRFVYAPIQGTLAATENTLTDLRAELRASFADVQRHRALTVDISANSLERQSIEERVQKLRDSLQGLSDTDSATIARQPDYEAEQRIANVIDRDLQSARQALQTALAELSRLPSKIDARVTENTALLRGVHKNLESFLTNSRDAVSGLIGLIDSPSEGSDLSSLSEGLAKWRGLRDQQKQRYEDAKSRASVHEQTLQQIRDLEERQAAILTVMDSKVQQLERLGDANQAFETQRQRWATAHRQRADLLSSRCEHLTSIGSPRLKATLQRAADLAPLSDRIKQTLRGTKIRSDKVDQLMAQVTAGQDPVAAWLWRAKGHRQVIFASHNANLVVNGDAELIVCCDYRTSGMESGGKIKVAGAIDIPEIRDEITEVMEGGPEAFQLRQMKYGF